MNNYFALTKILIKNSLSSFVTGKSKGKINNRLKNAALMIVIALSMLPIVAGIAAMVWGSYGVFKSMGQEGLILGSGLLSVCMLVLFFGIFYIMNVFYFSKDVESLLPLPLRPSTIMAAKFSVTLIYEYFTEIIVLAPVLVTFGLVSKAGIVYYLYAALAFLTLPIIPLIYAGVLNMLLMRYTNISKNRDQLRIVGGVIGMLVAIFANTKMQSLFSNTANPEMLKDMLLSGNNSLINMMTGIFPTNKFLTLALINSDNFIGLTNILLYIAISVLCVSLFLSLGESMYFKGLVGVSESKSRRKKLTNEQFNKSVVKSSVIRSFTLKEIRLLVRTPIYFINCVILNFIWPVILLIPLFTKAEEVNQIYELQSLISSGANGGLILAIAFGAVLFASGTNGITATAISREGTNIFVNKYIPISYTEQIMGKVMSGVIFGICALLSMLIAVAVLFTIPIYLIALIVIIGLLAVLFTSFIGILIDLNFPKLYWDNEQKAVKQNMNVMISILVSTAAAAIVIALTAIFKLNAWVVFGGILLIFGFANAVLYGLIKSVGESLFRKIEI